jgi:hypothetical protein
VDLVTYDEVDAHKVQIIAIIRWIHLFEQEQCKNNNKKHYFEFTVTGNQTTGSAAIESFLSAYYHI